MANEKANLKKGIKKGGKGETKVAKKMKEDPSVKKEDIKVEDLTQIDPKENKEEVSEK